MKRSLVLFALAFTVLAMVLAPMTARAGKACATYSVTAPVVGTKTGTHCSPPMPPDWDGYETWSDCGGIPPAGAAHCVRFTIYRPI